jgi:hypothetical protein
MAAPSTPAPVRRFSRPHYRLVRRIRSAEKALGDWPAIGLFLAAVTIVVCLIFAIR